MCNRYNMAPLTSHSFVLCCFAWSNSAPDCRLACMLATHPGWWSRRWSRPGGPHPCPPWFQQPCLCSSGTQGRPCPHPSSGTWSRGRGWRRQCRCWPDRRPWKGAGDKVSCSPRCSQHWCSGIAWPHYLGGSHTRGKSQAKSLLWLLWMDVMRTISSCDYDYISFRWWSILGSMSQYVTTSINML